MNEPDRQPIRIINSVAPVRICDMGGWTDTWFAEHGRVFNIGVEPYAEVQIRVYPLDRREERVIVCAENYGDRYTRDPDNTTWERHPLLEAVIHRVGIPDDVAVEISLYSEAPPGASIGTSASIVVALVGGLDQLRLRRRTPHEVAYEAHFVETGILNQQSGVQDQLCAAYGGINYIDMPHYPHASVTQIKVPDATLWELERRLVLIYLGRPHRSSQIHEQVIRRLESAGSTAQPLEALRVTAEPARDAVCSGDFVALGKVMIQNTEAQRSLHPSLISPDAQRVIEIAQAHDAIGWKVNGAGGDGGSLTVLCGASSYAKRAMIKEIEAESALFRRIPVHLSRLGLRVWESVPPNLQVL